MGANLLGIVVNGDGANGLRDQAGYNYQYAYDYQYGQSYTDEEPGSVV